MMNNTAVVVVCYLLCFCMAWTDYIVTLCVRKMSHLISFNLLALSEILANVLKFWKFLVLKKNFNVPMQAWMCLPVSWYHN